MHMRACYKSIVITSEPRNVASGTAPSGVARFATSIDDTSAGTPRSSPSTTNLSIHTIPTHNSMDVTISAPLLSSHTLTLTHIYIHIHVYIYTYIRICIYMWYVPCPHGKLPSLSALIFFLPFLCLCHCAGLACCSPYR